MAHWPRLFVPIGEREQRWARHDALALRVEAQLPWVAFYLFTIALQIPSMIARLMISVPVVSLGMLIAHGSVNHGQLNVIVALVTFGPIAFSLLSLAYPIGAGSRWQAQIGGREPSQREIELYDIAFASLAQHQPDLRSPRFWFVLDEPELLNAGVYGDTMMITSAMLRSEYLPAVLAHELGHFNSIDAHLSVALNRLSFARWAFTALDTEQQGCLAFPLWVVMGFCSGAIGFWLVRAPWARWYRGREYKADAYAAQLGQGELLRRMLEQHALPDDRPVPFRMLEKMTHPPTELRLDRLSKAIAQRGGRSAT